MQYKAVISYRDFTTLEPRTSTYKIYAPNIRDAKQRAKIIADTYRYKNKIPTGKIIELKLI